MKKFNWVDVVIILTIIASIVLIILKVQTYNQQSQSTEVENNGSAETANATLQLTIKDVRSYIEEAVEVGDIIYDDETDSPIGKVTKIESKPYFQAIAKNDGTAVLAQRPDRIIVTLTLESNLLERDMGYFAYGITEIKINSLMKIMSKKMLSTGTITAIEK